MLVVRFVDIGGMNIDPHVGIGQTNFPIEQKKKKKKKEIAYINVNDRILFYIVLNVIDTRTVITSLGILFF